MTESAVGLVSLSTVLGSLVCLPDWVNKRRNSLEIGEETIKAGEDPWGSHHTWAKWVKITHPYHRPRGRCPNHSITGKTIQYYFDRHNETIKTVLNSLL